MNLQGKIINVLGDSITQGVGVSSVENAYQNVMGRIVGAAEGLIDKHGDIRASLAEPGISK